MAKKKQPKLLPFEQIAVIHALRDRAHSLYLKWLIAREWSKGNDSPDTRLREQQILHTLNAYKALDEDSFMLWLAQVKPSTKNSLIDIMEAGNR